MKQYNGEKYIVSFTTFGKRIESACKMVFNLLNKQTYKNFHLVMTIYKDDVKNIGPNMQALIDNNLLEVIIADEDLGPHCKYYYVMQKYCDKPIITVDDDRYYDTNVIELLVKKYESLDYKSIVSNCAIKMGRTRDGHITPYPEWCGRRLNPNEKSYIAMAEGFAGILYPPNCFKDLSSEKENLLRCKYDDDLFLKTLHIKNKLPVTQVNFKRGYAETDNIQEMMKYNLHNNQNKGNTNRINMCRLFEHELLGAFSL